MDDINYDIVIIGSGAAGLGAALYTGRYRMKVLVVSKEFGGETASAGKIENYPGVPAIDGYELMGVMKKQAKELGVQFIDSEVTAINRQDHCFEVKTQKVTYQTHEVIFATGAERRRLGLPNEKVTDKNYLVNIGYARVVSGSLVLKKLNFSDILERNCRIV